jgi:GNAT superfamily N-acetyltransferase
MPGAAKRIALRRAGPDDAGTIVSVLEDAFEADPFFRWMFGPDPMAFRRGLNAWLNLIVGRMLPRGQGFLVGDDEGAVVWLPPGAELTGPDVLAARRLLEEQVGERAGEVLVAIASGGVGVPDAPHWLCLYIGVRPAAQGCGLGRSLLQPGLDAADAAGSPVHLVATNPATATFYERFGFRVLSEAAVAAGAPALRPMWRDRQVTLR